MPDQTTTTETTPAGVRYWVRVSHGMLSLTAGWSGWTVLAYLPDTPNVMLVEVADPNAPAAAAGRLCEPTLTRSGGRAGPQDPVEPFTVSITDYGITPFSVCRTCYTVQAITATAKIGHHGAPPWPDAWPETWPHRSCLNCCPGAGQRIDAW